ncbi:MAG: DUF378 domain-containing protein [Deltaproteobacteria bacterium]|nr:DUF378 domain-containing protein [Deltaproteobacteria bacterium]
MNRLSALTAIPLVLAIIGAINWGLVGFFNWNLVNAIFGGASQMDTSAVSRVVYAIVGLAGLSLVALWPKFREEKAAVAHRRSEARP